MTICNELYTLFQIVSLDIYLSCYDHSRMRDFDQNLLFKKKIKLLLNMSENVLNRILTKKIVLLQYQEILLRPGFIIWDQI